MPVTERTGTGKRMSAGKCAHRIQILPKEGIDNPLLALKNIIKMKIYFKLL